MFGMTTHSHQMIGSEKIRSRDKFVKERRRLAAIMVTDIVSYTELMSKDEQKALKLLVKSRNVLRSLIQRFNGELLKHIGDGTLSTFESAVEAVKCSIEIQHSLSNEHDFKLRIGIHVGDIIFTGGDVFGDGVNIASKIEPLAEPGGICISKHVHDKIKNFPDIRTVSLGLKELKNVGEPLEVYKIMTERASSVKAMKEGVTNRSRPINSIAVLPFTNMSADPEQEYFCDGMAEELINALMHVEGLYVVARTSAFAFKGKPLDIRDIGRRLNVKAMLEGSVRKAGNRLRITAQLINVADGYHLWSERYDREMEDLFAIQEEIAHNIVQALKVELSQKEERALSKTPTKDVQAYDFYLRGREFFYKTSRKNINYAREIFAQAIKRDPSYALAYAGIADCYSYLFMYFDRNKVNLKQAMTDSQKALELDSELAEAHAARGLAVSLSKRYEEAEREFETAIRLNSKLFEAYYFYARTCFVQGKRKKAAQLFEKASQVNPEDYQSLMLLGCTLRGMNLIAKAEVAYRRALENVRRYLDLNPDDSRAVYAGSAALIDLGEKKKGLQWTKRALSLSPEDPYILYGVVCTYSLLGEVEEAIRYFEKTLEAGFAHTEWIENDADLNSIRNHPRFQALLKKL
jgi:adenylate cyclase